MASIGFSRAAFQRCAVSARGRNALSGRILKALGVRNLHTTQFLYSQPGPPDSGAVKKDILYSDLQGGHTDIRSYLREWQAKANYENIDPIKIRADVNRDNEPQVQVQGHGTMLNDEMVLEDSDISSDADTYSFLDSEYDSRRFIQPGDLVSLQGSGVGDGQLAIYIRANDAQQQFFTKRGKWRVEDSGKVDFVSPGFVPSESLKCLLPYLPTGVIQDGPLPQIAREGGVPRSIGGHFVRMLNEFESEATQFYADNPMLENLHNALAQETNFVTMTFDEILVEFFGERASRMTLPQQSAVRRALLRHAFEIIPNRVGPFIESFTLRPKMQSRDVDQAVRWTRQYAEYRQEAAMSKNPRNFDHHPMTKFIKKAQRLITLSRKTRFPDATASNIPPSLKEKPEDQKAQGDLVLIRKEVDRFSEEDRKIISYLRSVVVEPTLTKARFLRVAASTIIQSTKMYDEGVILSPQTVYLFLQEIGVFSPWENLQLLKDQLQLPGHGISAQTDEMATKVAELCKNETFTDSMKSYRKDWGDMPVFCVDDAHAAEIDDGFSLEPVSGEEEEGTFWIHIHVANPSAFVPFGHPAAVRAAGVQRTFYSPERTYPMLPHSLTNKNLSLAPGRPTLTFSAKVNADGDIKDISVRNGIIHNVNFIDPNTVAKHFGVDYDSTPSMKLAVGGDMPERQRSELADHIDPEHRSVLDKLRDLLVARKRKRTEKGGLDAGGRYSSRVSIYSGKEPIPPHSAAETNAYHYFGDPWIQSREYVTDFFGKIDTTKENIVSHVMLLGGEIAGQWCRERGIPAIFSGTQYHPEYERITNERIADGSGSTLSIWGLPRGLLSPSPVEHHFLGMDQYVKATSPLRRYSDLLAHYQIEAALRYEQENKKTFSIVEAEDALPFSRNSIANLIDQVTFQNKAIDRGQNNSRLFWACQLLSRALYHNEAKLPTSFECLIKGSARVPRTLLAADEDQAVSHLYMGSLLPFQFPCIVSQKKTCQMPRTINTGDLVKVELTGVNIYNLNIETDLKEFIRTPRTGPLAARGFIG